MEKKKDRYTVHNVNVPLTNPSIFEGNWDDTLGWLLDRSTRGSRAVDDYVVWCFADQVYVHARKFMNTPAVPLVEKKVTNNHTRICGAQVQDIITSTDHVHVCWNPPAQEGHGLGILLHKCSCGDEWTNLFKRS